MEDGATSFHIEGEMVFPPEGGFGFALSLDTIRVRTGGVERPPEPAERERLAAFLREEFALRGRTLGLLDRWPSPGS